MVPDYYARLEIAPDANRPAIESALQRKQPMWSMGTRNPKTRHANQLYLDEVPALRRALLGDPSARAAYDAELAIARRGERDAALDELQRRARLRAAKGGLNALDRRLLNEQAARLGLNEDDVARLVRTVPVLNGDPANAVGAAAPEDENGAPVEALDASTRRQIHSALNHLGRRDLYDALGVPRDASLADIELRADAERQRWMKKARVTAEKTAWLEVITHAQTHLGSPMARLRYDRALDIESEEAFETVAGFALEGLLKLDAGTRRALVEEAARMGIASDHADRLIERACRKRDVRFGPTDVLAHANGAAAWNGSASLGGGGGGGAPKLSLLRCRGCGGVTELSAVARKAAPAASTRCPHCGASLRWDCPACRRVSWMDEPACVCGFRLALREPVSFHFGAARQAFGRSELDQAAEHLERALELAPGFTAAENALRRIDQRRADRARRQVDYQAARAGGKLAEARAALEAWGRSAGPRSPEIQAAWNELAPSLRRASALAGKARRLEKIDPRAARGLYRQCLDVASDWPEALQGLERTPPDPPEALEAHALGDCVRLQWSPPPPDGFGPVSFIVLRKRGGALAHPADGVRIAEVDDCEYEDRALGPGERAGYAVLSRRGAGESLAAVSLDAPVLFLPDVMHARATPLGPERGTDKGLELAWLPPKGMFEARVVRRRGGPPNGPRDGDRLTGSFDRAVDPDWSPGQQMYYTIFAIYKMADGRLYPAPGTILNPDQRPEPRFELAPAPTAPTPPLNGPSAPVEGPLVEARRNSVLAPSRTERTIPVVDYRLNRPWLPGLPWSLTFRIAPRDAVLPPLVVVAHPRAVPLAADDGHPIARLDDVRDGARRSFRPPFNLSRYGVRVFPDPTMPPDALAPIRFEHPEDEPARA